MGVNEDNEKDMFIHEVLLVLQNWASGEITECPISLPVIQINMMCGRLDRITKILQEDTDGH